MRGLASVLLLLFASSTCGVPLKSCKKMENVYECIFPGNRSRVPPFPFAPKKGDLACGASRVATCCSKKMENSFNGILRSMMDHIKEQADSLERNLLSMYKTKREQLNLLLLTFTRTLLNGASNNCRRGMDVLKSLEELFRDVFPVYEGMIPSMDDAVVTFFYSLSTQYIQQSIDGSRLSLKDAPTLDALSDYNMKLCIANWGHHRHFTQNNSNLMSIACCMDTFILLSKRIALTLSKLSATMSEVKSNLLRVCPSCKVAFVRNMFCHRCNNHPTVGACPSQCTRVVQECFPGLTKLNDAWNDVLDSVEELIDALGNSRGICSCMNSIESAVEAYCGNLAKKIENGKALTQSLIADCSERSGRPLTFGSNLHISDFLYEIGVPRSWYEGGRNVQANDRNGSLVDGSLRNMPHGDLSSCLGAETGSGQQLPLQSGDVRSLRNIFMPQNRLFGDFCRPSSGCSSFQLVSHDGHCWNGTKVVPVEANAKDNPQEILSSTRHASQPRITVRESRPGRACRSNPTADIVKNLRKLAKHNRLYLCQDPNSSASNGFCKRCGSGFLSGD